MTIAPSLPISRQADSSSRLPRPSSSLQTACFCSAPTSSSLRLSAAGILHPGRLARVSAAGPAPLPEGASDWCVCQLVICMPPAVGVPAEQQRRSSRKASASVWRESPALSGCPASLGASSPVSPCASWMGASSPPHPQDGACVRSQLPDWADPSGNSSACLSEELSCGSPFASPPGPILARGGN